VDENRDGDGDGYIDVADYSPNTADSNNIDSDGDGYGNVIDADFNNDGTVSMTDFSRFQNAMNSYDSDADMNGDGTISMLDFALFQNKLGQSEPYYKN
jgi:hypothetical protein